MTNRHRAGGIAVLALVVLLAALAVPLGVAHAAVAFLTPHAHVLGALALATGPAVTASPLWETILPVELASRHKRSYFAPLEFLALAAGGAAPAILLSDINHDFVVTALRYVARDVTAAAAMLVAPLVLVDMSLVNGALFTPVGFPVELDAIAGANRGSQELLIPLIIPAGETLSVQARNGTNAAMNLRITLVGFRSERARR